MAPRRPPHRHRLGPPAGARQGCVPASGTGAEFRALRVPPRYARLTGRGAPKDGRAVGTVTSGSAARILVVDDEEQVRGSMVRLLERLGYDVAGVEDGEAALRRVR